MKLSTHPKKTRTVIQMKDGSTYKKRWLFFRNTLSLEIDFLGHVLWRKNTK
jgi:hypothetical protein